MTDVGAAERVVEQPAGLDPVAAHGAHGDVQRFRRLFFRHATEEPTLHDASEPLVEPCEMLECFVQLEERLEVRLGGREVVIEGDVPS